MAKNGDGYEQLYDGEWFRVRKKHFLNACCDCGLVHVLDHRDGPNNSLEMRVTVDRRATAAHRRSFNFTKDDD